MLLTQSFRWILGPNLDCTAQPCWDKYLKMSGNTLCCNTANEYRSLCVPEITPPTCLGVELKIQGLTWAWRERGREGGGGAVMARLVVKSVASLPIPGKGCCHFPHMGLISSILRGKQAEQISVCCTASFCSQGTADANFLLVTRCNLRQQQGLIVLCLNIGSMFCINNRINMTHA